MAAGFAPHLLEEIRSRVDVVEVVGQFVRLKRAGENWKGLCPFHTEKTPSFTVHPRRQIFHCFGCGVGGDAFSFLMRQERLSFPEAVRTLAERAGVTLPARREAPEAEGKFEALRRVMALAADFYERALWGPDGQRARAYLEARGVEAAVARRFGLGCAPEGWNALLTHMTTQGVGEAELVQAGLVLPRQTTPGFYDRFRHRLLFPIRDVQGRPVAFGGRALSPADEPKYLNSPETPLYVKGQMLYALDQARAAIREKSRAIVVEGYLDCLMAHQHGFPETVAALGTAFTPAQLGLLRRSCEEVVALFDGDAAGQKAAARLEDLLGEAQELGDLAWSVTRVGGLERPGYFAIKVALLPEGHDPDSLLRAEGAPGLQARLAAARSVLAFALDRTLGEEDLSTARGRAAAHAGVALLLSRVSNAAEATDLAREAARRLGVDPTQLWIEAQQLRGARARRPERPVARGEPAPAPGGPPPSRAERDLLALLLHVQDARAALLPVIDDEDLAHPGLRTILSLLRRAEGPPEALLAHLDGEAERALLAALLVEERQWSDVQSHVRELRTRYDIRQRKKRVSQVTQAIARAQASGDPTLPQLEDELRRLQQDLQREAEAVRELALSRPFPGGRTPWTPEAGAR